MKHICDENKNEEPVVYIGDDFECGEDVSDQVSSPCSGGYNGAGYYLIIAEEYLMEIFNCPFCGKQLIETITPKNKITPELTEDEYESVIRALAMADDEFGVELFYILRHKLTDKHGKPVGYDRCD